MIIVVTILVIILSCFLHFYYQNRYFTNKLSRNDGKECLSLVVPGGNKYLDQFCELYFKYSGLNKLIISFNTSSGTEFVVSLHNDSNGCGINPYEARMMLKEHLGFDKAYFSFNELLCDLNKMPGVNFISVHFCDYNEKI